MGTNDPGVAQEKTVVTFPCPGCGGQMLFDTESQHLKCRYCGNEKVIGKETDEPSEHELVFTDEDALDDSLKDWGIAQQTVKCGNCGGEMILPASQTAAVCAFCGSAEVLPQGDSGGIRPESLIPFHVSKDEAAEAFRSWKKRRWFVPNAFKNRNIHSVMAGIYIPFWTFDANTVSAYTAEVGIYHYRTETRTRTVNGKSETYTVQVRYTVWHWTSGNYDRYFDDVLIPASAQHDGPLLGRMNDFALGKLAPYSPEYISGFIAERYTVPLKEGWNEAKVRIKGVLTSEIEQQTGGDEVRNLSISTHYADQTFKHILLPVWNASYPYKDKTYRYVVNGETGSVFGHVPRSPLKITLFVLLCIAVAAVIIYLFSQQR